MVRVPSSFEKVDRAKRLFFSGGVQLALATHFTKNDQGWISP